MRVWVCSGRGGEHWDAHFALAGVGGPSTNHMHFSFIVSQPAGSRPKIIVLIIILVIFVVMSAVFILYPSYLSSGHLDDFAL